MKKKYKYLFLSSIVIGNLVTSPVFALTGETSTNETTVSETTPIMENLMEETTKILSSEETISSSTAEVPEGTNEVENSSSSTEDGENEQETTTSSTSTDRSSTETSQTENNKETRDVTTDGNWNYHISGEYAYLDSYVGSSTNIVVPNEINGKQTLISLFSGVPVSKINQQQVTSITFSNDNGKKCKLDSSSINFSNHSSLQTFDGKGLDISSASSMYNLFANCGNLISADVSNWDTSNITNMYSAFSHCSNLQTLDVSNWNTSKVENFSYTFYYCSSLQKLDVSRWNTSSATSLYYIFNNCSSLQTIDVSKWDTSNVNKMTRVFNQCSNLTSVDVSNWDTSKVQNFTSMFNACTKLANVDISRFSFKSASNMDYMFCNCPSMSVIDLSNATLPSNISMLGVFYIDNKTLPLLVKAIDPKLLNYNYSADNRVPIGPSFNANGGHFSDNSDTKYYFEKCALEPTDPKFQLSTFNDYKNTVEKPIKDGSLFHEWQLTSGTEPTKNDDLLNSNIVYSAQWIPSLINDHIPSQDVDNVKPDQSSIFGIAYMPKAFDFSPVTLHDAGSQSIGMTLEGGNYHVAVRDQRMMASGWSLQAQLKWNGKEIPGAEILTLHQGIEVLKNTNDGSQDFNAESDFESCSLYEVRANRNVVIRSDAPSVLMTAATKEHNAVYDYDLGRVTLRIPEVKYIQPGSYSGYVNWSLVNAPST